VVAEVGGRGGIGARASIIVQPSGIACTVASYKVHVFPCLEKVGPMSVQTFKNVILQRLHPEVIDRLELQRVELPVNREIEFPGSGIANLFFIE